MNHSLLLLWFGGGFRRRRRRFAHNINTLALDFLEFRLEILEYRIQTLIFLVSQLTEIPIQLLNGFLIGQFLNLLIILLEIGPMLGHFVILRIPKQILNGSLLYPYSLTNMSSLLDLTCGNVSSAEIP
jgi:hypothetical protein